MDVEQLKRSQESFRELWQSYADALNKENIKRMQAELERLEKENARLMASSPNGLEVRCGSYGQNPGR